MTCFAAYSDVGFFSSVGLFSSFKGEKTITQKWEVILYVDNFSDVRYEIFYILPTTIICTPSISQFVTCHQCE